MAAAALGALEALGQVEELLISGALEETRPELGKVLAIFAQEIPDSEGETKRKDRLNRRCPTYS